jgi:hypothetical protein
MKEHEPEWPNRLKGDPFARKTFTLEHIQRIEEQAAALVVEQSRPQRGNWRMIISVASVIMAIIIGIGLYQVDTPPGLPSPSSPMPEPTLQVTQTEPPEGNKENVHRLRGMVEALDSPIAFGSGPISFLTEEDEVYEVLEREGAFVRIMPNSSQSFYTGWIPEWYLLSEGASQIEEEIEPYLLLVDQPVTFSLYPEEPEPSGFELNSGKVVQVTGRYEAWLRVNIVTYDSPYSGDKWILESALAKWDPAKAKEGILNPGALVYDEKGEVQEGPHSINPIRISAEEGARYRISAAGGYTGLIDKADFIPGPFLKVIDQSGDSDGDVDWFMSEEEVQA